jgi:hypothetical protein
MSGRSWRRFIESKARSVLNAWSYGLVTEDAVVAWADQTFVDADRPEALPDWMYKLSELGPTQCAELPWQDFSFGWKYEFREYFLARLSQTNPEDRHDVERFVRFAAERYTGDFRVAEFEFGQLMRVLLHEEVEGGGVDGAIDAALDELPDFVAEAHEVRRRLLDAAGIPETGL